MGPRCPLGEEGARRGPQPSPCGAQGEAAGGGQSHRGLLRSHGPGVPKVPQGTAPGRKGFPDENWVSSLPLFF